MHPHARSLLFLCPLAWLCACSPIPPLAQRPPAQPQIPVFSGGGNGTRIAGKKAELTLEYQELASAESKLEYSKYLLIRHKTWTPQAYQAIALQEQDVTMYQSRVDRHQAEVNRLRSELRAAGVTVTTHY